MGYIPPPQLAGERESYLEAYNKILSSHRRSPLSAASSVIMLVAPNVDALCASRMLATLFKQDDVVYRIIPVSGPQVMLIRAEELSTYPDLHTLILIDMGSTLELTQEDWFGSFDLKVTVHVIDSRRPRSLTNLFMGGKNGDRIIVWDDGDSDELKDEKISYETVLYNPEPDPNSEEDDGSDDEDDLRGTDDESEHEHEETYDASGSQTNKRRRGARNAARKRSRRNSNLQTLPREEIEFHQRRVDRYYAGGAWYGQSVAGTIYILATVLERVDNDFLWLGILGLTFQYNSSRISRERYESYQTIYFDEVSRLNPQPSQSENAHSLVSVNPDDISVRSTEELRFMLFRHWTLYDAMYHSSYVASKLGIWKEKGRQRLTGLLAKMGFSIPQTQQPFSHMDMDLKKNLIQKLNDIAPEYGLVELTYPSFMRCYGFHTQPLSAADAVEGICALLDVAEGHRMEVEIEGTRNGGEWFGAGRVWEVRTSENNDLTRRKQTDFAPKPTAGTVPAGNGEVQDNANAQSQELEWWVKNFWTAYDSLSDVSALRRSLNLAMSLQRAVIRNGTSIIDKQDIKTMRSHRVVVMTQGPDLALFSHPSILTRLALWLVDALRDRLPPIALDPAEARWKKRSLPFVVACLNETTQFYTIVGITAALDFGQVRKNQFITAFTQAVDSCKIDFEFDTFDASVVRLHQDDLSMFLQTLCNLS